MVAPIVDWKHVLAEGSRIVHSYNTPVTLRQLHYRLVAARVGGYDNTTKMYKRLSSWTAKGRRGGTFPRLADSIRVVEPSLTTVHRPMRSTAWR